MQWITTESHGRRALVPLDYEASKVDAINQSGGIGRGQMRSLPETLRRATCCHEKECDQ